MRNITDKRAISKQITQPRDFSVAERFIVGEIYTWAEVNQFHRTRNGVYQKNERLISLLTDFGRINSCYPDRADETGSRVFYTGNGRRGDQPLNPANRALLAAVESAHAVPLFNKLAIGRWRFEGFWLVAAGEYVFDQETDRMIWRFTLERATNTSVPSAVADG